MAQQRQETTRPSAFLFLAGNSALDFVNTRPVLRGHAIELLQDFADLLRWFVAAQLLDPKLAAKFRERWASSPQAHASLRQLLAFRELLRREIAALESSKAVSKKTISGLNRRLAQHPLLAQLVIFHGILRKEYRFQPRKPLDLFAPLLYAATDLFTSLDPLRLRQCQSCVLHFYDTTKNATRRWCSMKLCGNRAKAAKYAARHRHRSG